MPPPPSFGGRGNGRVEVFKFCLYVSIPIVASIIYGTPENMQKIVHQFRFVEYPAEDKEDVLVGQSVSREERRQATAAAQGKKEAASSSWLSGWRK